MRILLKKLFVMNIKVVLQKEDRFDCRKRGNVNYC